MPIIEELSGFFRAACANGPREGRKIHSCNRPISRSQLCGSPGVHHLTLHWSMSSPVPAKLVQLPPLCRSYRSSDRKSSPVVRIAQAMRANLLTSATVTSAPADAAGAGWSRQPKDPAVCGATVSSPSLRGGGGVLSRDCLLGNPAQPFLPTAGILSRNQTQPRREVSTGAEHGGIGNKRREGRADKRAGLNRLSRSAFLLPSLDLLVDRRQIRVHRPQLIG